MGTVKDITLQKEQDKQLARQSKMEALGELMSNVAHQWRQPLNLITLTASGLYVQEQLDSLKKEVLLEDLQKISILRYDKIQLEEKLEDGVSQKIEDVIVKTDRYEEQSYGIFENKISDSKLHNKVEKLRKIIKENKSTI
jgi:signal transduction histidine kinase